MFASYPGSGYYVDVVSAQWDESGPQRECKIPCICTCVCAMSEVQKEGAVFHSVCVMMLECMSVLVNVDMIFSRVLVDIQLA